MKESGDVGLLFAPLIPFPAQKFWEQMGTKGTRKFRFSAPQPIVYDACNCVTLRCFIYPHLGRGQNNDGGGKKRGGNKSSTYILLALRWPDYSHID